MFIVERANRFIARRSAVHSGRSVHRETFPMPHSMSNRTIRILDEGEWSGRQRTGGEGRGGRKFVLCPRKKKEKSAVF